METIGLAAGESLLRWQNGQAASKDAPQEGTTALSRKRARGKNVLTNAVQALLSPFFMRQQVIYFDIEGATSGTGAKLPPPFHMEVYDGISVIPDDLVEFIEPRAGEAVAVFSLGKKVVGYVRAAFRDVFFEDVYQFVKVPPGQALLYDPVTLPEFRGSLDPHLFAAAARAFHAQGFDRVFTIADCAFPHQIASLERAGFRRFKTVTVYRILGKRLLHTREHAQHQNGVLSHSPDDPRPKQNRTQRRRDAKITQSLS